MKKPWLLIIGIVVIVAAAALYVMATRDTTKPSSTVEPTQTKAPEQPSADVAAEPTAPVEQPGAYTPYSAAAVATTQGRKVLFFHAPWCPQCRALEQSIQAGSIPANVTIFKTDFDSSTDLRTKYGVTMQTTLVEIDSEGRLINKYVAYSQPTLQAVVTNLGLDD